MDLIKKEDVILREAKVMSFRSWRMKLTMETEEAVSLMDLTCRSDIYAWTSKTVIFIDIT